jgi:NAD-dependent SIR2 family protein deacetylase
MVELTDETSEELERAARAILSSNHLVALAGAGLSVESG